MTLQTQIDLRAEAIAEAQRVSASRAWGRSDAANSTAQHALDRPLVARARRHKTRERLGDRLLLVFRVRAQDSAGRTIDTALLGALVKPLSSVGRARERLRRAVRDAEAAARPPVGKACAQWLDAARAVAAAFVAVRLTRERAIRDRASAAAPESVQPGLFDRRAEHAHDVAAAIKHDRRELMQARLDAAASHSIATHTLELVLVLTPR